MVINMFSHNFNIYFLVAALCVFMCAGNSTMKRCVETEKQALLKLKANFIDDSGILSSWKHEVDCCEWNGISCNYLTGHVTKLQVPFSDSRYLEGKIGSSLCDLHHLTLLNLSSNYFRGNEIPKCIGSLNQLRELILSHAYLGGTIPRELQNLSYLQILDLGHNYGLIVNDFEWISNLSSLRHLDLSGVNLNQTTNWQSSISRKAPQSLRELMLSSANLVSIISLQLGNLSDLETLDLSCNYDLIVNDLKWISHLSSLRHLDLSFVNLSKAIDWQSSLSKMSSLFELRLDNCDLPQVNPKSLIYNNYTTSLTSLSLADNDLNTSILYWVSNISKTFIEIDLSRNTFQHIPADIFSNMNSLRCLDLSLTSIQLITTAFTNTTSLESLDLSYNNLDNDIGEAISNLCQIRELDLSYNNLLGPLSDFIPQLHCAQHSIETLDFTNNPFRSGSFPDFWKFSSLVSLHLYNTGINGPIPQSLGPWPHLSVLDISQNNLSGSFPKLNKLSSLEKLDLSHNKLNGVVNEVHLSTLPKLIYLDVSGNFLSFNFSSKCFPPFQLRTFLARSCNFSMGFPMWLEHQRGLRELDISNCSISDSLPEWIWLFLTLENLNISHNKIYGELPRSLPESESIWDFSFNNLSGPIPHFSPQVQILLLSNNKFSGSVSSLCSTLLSRLHYLDMSSNLLSGKLPHCWRQFLDLEVLVLANNNFSRMIPPSIGTLEYIKTIHLNNNNFSGEIPSLRHSSQLKFIDLGQNNLHGKLPTWIGNHLLDLIVLRLQANKLHGKIPTSLCNLSLLQILDLSQNTITGTIPHCLNSLNVLSDLNFSRDAIFYPAILDGYPWRDTYFLENAMLNWKGNKVKYDKNLGLMTAIDLSSNHLIGEIPTSITSLVALVSLNLSRNNFTGFIPKNMGQMRMLESLDLSRNSLSGGIPISFSALSFLSFLNVSFNNLSGEIPQTTQLQTFDPSNYIGNNGLCGQPLTKGCSKNDDFHQNHKTSSTIDANEEDDLITLGFYISMTLGFLVGFWGVCGTLILKSSWRAAYFQFFTNMYDWIYVHLAIFKARMKRRFKH